MSVIEDNIPAKRLLTSGLSEYPYAQEYARLFTYAIYPLHRKRKLDLPHSLHLVRGSEKYIDKIVDCLNRNNERKQFAPHWTCDSLFIGNLKPSDFFLAFDGDRTIGCISCWDQTAFKQTVVRGYSSPLVRWRKLLNILSGLGGWPYLPDPNTLLRYSYASHLAIDNDDPVIFSVLLRALYQHNLEYGYTYFMLGLAEPNPLRAVVQGYRPLTYVSQLYLVTWDKGQAELANVDYARVPAPEIAVL